MLRKLKLFLPKIIRSSRRVLFITDMKHTGEERLIKSIVCNFLSNPDCKVIYSPLKKSVRIQTRDKKHTISVSTNFIYINDSHFSIRDLFGSHLLEKCIGRIESDIQIMDSFINSERSNFLKEIKNSSVRAIHEYERRIEILEKSSSDNMEEIIIEKVLNI